MLNEERVRQFSRCHFIPAAEFPEAARRPNTTVVLHNSVSRVAPLDSSLCPRIHAVPVPDRWKTCARRDQKRVYDSLSLFSCATVWDYLHLCIFKWPEKFNNNGKRKT